MIFAYLCGAGVNNTFALILSIAVSVIVPYLLGSLNFGIIFSRLLYKADVRDSGSGNAGSTNMLRTYGKKAGILTFLGDCAKTALAISVGLLMLLERGMFIAGLFCMIGHTYPIFFKFKGGKGVACFAILVLMTCIKMGIWYVFLILFAMFAIIVIGTKYVSLGSIVCSLIYPIILNRFIHMFENNPYQSVEMFAVFAGLFVVFQHRSNIVRLFKGNENKINLFKKKDKKNTEEK